MENVIISVRVPKKVVEILKEEGNISKIVRELLIAEAERIRAKKYEEKMKIARKIVEKLKLSEIVRDIRKFREAR